MDPWTISTSTWFATGIACPKRMQGWPPGGAGGGGGGGEGGGGGFGQGGQPGGLVSFFGRGQGLHALQIATS